MGLNEELTPLDFLAYIINEKVAKDNEYSEPTRWLALKEEIKQDYLQNAREIFEDWKNEELKYEKERQKFNEENNK